MALQQPPLPEDWRDWLAEAHSVISAWERDGSTHILSTRESILLAERIAKAMHVAYVRGQGSSVT